MTAVLVTGMALVAIWLMLRLVAARQTIRDLTGRLAAAELLAVTDPLTGLANRAGLERALGTALPVHGDLHVALLLLDLDRLKFINDRYGHSTGDAVLVEIARRIAQQAAPVVSAARLGGDEFVVVLAPAAHAHVSHYAEEYAQALRRTIGTPVAVDNLTLRVTASVGVAVLPATDIDQLLGAADQAMYRAKHTGAGICRYYPHLDGTNGSMTAESRIPKARTVA
jgi:diguanylate cyclase (GGDEF)-like protein